MVERESVKMCAALVQELLRDPQRTPDKICTALNCSRAAFYNYKALLQEHFGFVFTFDRKAGRFLIETFGMFAKVDGVEDSMTVKKAIELLTAQGYIVHHLFPLLPKRMEIRTCRNPQCQNSFVIQKGQGYSSRKFYYACRK